MSARERRGLTASCRVQPNPKSVANRFATKVQSSGEIVLRLLSVFAHEHGRETDRAVEAAHVLGHLGTHPFRERFSVRQDSHGAKR